MRHYLLPPMFRVLLVTLALVFVGHGTALGDSRSDARTHYQAGVKFYSSADYRSAIREFSAAQNLAPADLNNYNLALCYDKLGDSEPAIQYYRAYLDKVPNTDKRAEIEASMARLDAAAKSVAAKKADEARKIDEARKADEAKRAAEDAKRVAEEARKEEAARRAAEDESRKRRDNDVPEPSVGSGVPSTGVQSYVSTGDAQLDRAQSIDVNAIRDQRVGAPNSGIASAPTAGTTGQGQIQQAPNGQATPPTTAQAGAPPVNGAAPPAEEPKKADPIYKKWWFWAVIGVGAFVLINIAMEDSSDNVSRTMPPLPGPSAPPSGGATLFRW